MSEDFQYDAFLSHSAKDKAVVRSLAERLRQDGLKVWFDEWVLKPGDSIPAKIEEGLEHSQFTFQPSAFTLQPFLDAPLKRSLAQFLHINWRPADREQEYAKLLEVCWWNPKCWRRWFRTRLGRSAALFRDPSKADQAACRLEIISGSFQGIHV